MKAVCVDYEKTRNVNGKRKRDTSNIMKIAESVMRRQKAFFFQIHIKNCMERCLIQACRMREGKHIVEQEVMNGHN